MGVEVEGAQACVISDPDNSDRVFKIYKSGGREAARSEFLWLKTAKALGISVPTPLGISSHSGQGVLVMEALDGADFEESVWTLECDTTLILRRMLAFRRQLAARPTLEILVNAGGSPTMKMPLARRLRSRLVEGPVFDTKDEILAFLDGTADEYYLCHLDLHPANIMVTKHDAYLIDWADAMLGPRVADDAATLVRLRSFSLPPDAPEENVSAFRENVGTIESGFLAAVQEDTEQIDEWVRVLAADAFVRRAGDGDALLKMIVHGLREF